jgi:hypothetical protein
MSQTTLLVEELSQVSADFRRLWGENQISVPGEGAKRLVHPVLGTIDLEFSAFAVDGRVDLNLMVYTPVDPDVAEQIRRLALQR